MLHLEVHNGLVVSHIVCDRCGKPIQEAIQGVVVVSPEGKAKIVHRSGGDFSCDTRPKGCTWLPLEVVLLQLRQNCKFDIKKVEATMALWETLP